MHKECNTKGILLKERQVCWYYGSTDCVCILHFFPEPFFCWLPRISWREQEWMFKKKSIEREEAQKVAAQMVPEGHAFIKKIYRIWILVHELVKTSVSLGYSRNTNNRKRNTYVMTVTSCVLGGPRNSSFTLCSSIQMTTPVNMKDRSTIHHKVDVNGIRKAQGLFALLSFTGSSTTNPDSMYGCVKSTIRRRSARIATSPTTASYSWP